MRYRKTGLIVVAGGLMAWPTMAQPPGDGGERVERGRGSELRERVRAEFDKDGDGRLNEEEQAAAREAMRERRGRGNADNPPRGEGPRDGERGPEGRRRPDRPDGDRGPEARRRPGPPDDEREGRPEGPAGRRSDRNIETLFVWFDNDGDNMLSRAEFGELSQFLRRHRPGPPPGAIAGSPGGPRFGRRGPDGPPAGDSFGRGRGEGPPGPPRDREFGRRGRGPDGPPRGDRPIRRDGERRDRGDREGRAPQGDGPPNRPVDVPEEAV